ncbi:Na+/proline symporter [Balneicella halophila]|uniref:Na+/proline symporter n=1 Tax=Balneicella halophila TaxID=1537566 RepID=A0A7L4UPB6_BALHA|nr:sodium:solute symporter [Balneicella halophila]PVX50983.1 Na+/proline symporter [Balneicella halophila]
MNSFTLLAIVAGYFGILLLLSYTTAKNTNNDTFFRANKQSPWYLVAFGMIGASLSGVTFLSIPGVVGSGGTNSNLAYMQIVFGYVFGYIVIANILLPLYYKLNLTSIYTYLEQRFGSTSHKTGAVLFMVSKIIGAAFRLFLVVIVLQNFIMEDLGVPFYITAVATLMLIWLYTFRGGIKTIVWTDTLQTASMLLSLVFSVIILTNALELDSWSKFVSTIEESGYAKMFYFDNGWGDANFFWKQFFSGMFITIVMTGLDQDMMQKNLTCKTLKDSQKNMYTLGFALVPVNFIFLLLGILLFLYMGKFGIPVPTEELAGVVKPRYDLVYPTIALKHFSPAVGIVFIIGVVAAAFSSADSALTSLTTSYSVDFLNMDKKENKDFTIKRNFIHVAFSIILLITLLGFWIINDESVINSLFKAAGYTYGPLLGLFSFGLFTKYQIRDKLVPFIAILSPILTYLFSKYSKELLWGYEVGFELLIINGLLTFVLLMLSRKKNE